jgi:vancomycin resistance protein YoaR
MATETSAFYPVPAEDRARGRIRRSPLDFAALFLLLAALFLVTLVALWQVWHINRIYSGVTVAGIPVGGLTRAVAQARLQAELGSASGAQADAVALPPVSLTWGERTWTLDPMQLHAQPDLAAAVNDAYLVGRTGRPGDRLAHQLAAFVGQESITPDLAYDDALLAEAVAGVAASLNREARPARQIGAIQTAAQSAVTVDEAATRAALVQALAAAPAGRPLQVHVIATESAPPAADPAQPAPAVELVPAVAEPLLLSSAAYGLEFAIDPATLSGMVASAPPLTFDQDKLRAWLEDIAAEVDLPARDARLRFNPATGGVMVIQESLPGRRLDVEATMNAISAGAASGSTRAELAVAEVAPAVDANRVAEMGIRELVASGSTYFAGSSADRIRNIEVAAEKFDGVVVPPGEVFSFNRYVEDVSAANGFEDALVIWGDRTAVGIGGGVCQVSTTVFRAAYLGGFPIVERYNHGYVVDWYGEPGLDATIFTPSVDFKFRNDTSAYLLIEPVVDAANGVMTFNFYGTRPDRQVTVSDPKISDVIEPPAPLYERDESLAAGSQKQVDWAKQGMNVVVERTIVQDGTTRTDTLNSKYQPWRAVYLVGPGVEIPATPTPAAPPAEANAVNAANAAGAAAFTTP